MEPRCESLIRTTSNYYRHSQTLVVCQISPDLLRITSYYGSDCDSTASTLQVIRMVVGVYRRRSDRRNGGRQAGRSIRVGFASLGRMDVAHSASSDTKPEEASKMK